MTALPRRRTAVLMSVLVAGALAACGGGPSAPSSSREGDGGDGGGGGKGVAAVGPADAQTVMIDSTDVLTFEPDTVTAKVGTVTVTLGNSGQISHNLVFDDASLPSIGTVTGGKELSVTYTFTEPGTYPFVCTFHNGMDGKVVVT